jgi:hypothetical protein
MSELYGIPKNHEENRYKTAIIAIVSVIKNVLTVSIFNLYQHFLSRLKFTLISLLENSAFARADYIVLFVVWFAAVGWCISSLLAVGIECILGGSA